MRILREFGVIVVVPRIYVREAMREYHLGYWPAIIRLIQDHTDVELPDNANACAAFDMEAREDFETNSLLVCITATEQIPGFFELRPGFSYPHTRLGEFNNE